MEKTANSQTGHQRLLLTNKNYFVWEVMMSGELDNTNCLDYVLGVDKDKDKKDKRVKKSATLITRYLDEENIGTVALAFMVLGKLSKSFKLFIQVVTHNNKKLEVEDVIRKLEKEDVKFRVGHKEEKKGVAFTNKDPIALVATVEEQLSALFGSEKKKDTILDLGASEHMFTRREDFHTYQESTGKVQTGKENTKIKVIGQGKVVKYYKGKKVVFKNCLNVPQVPYNLISLTSL
ncbi:hypothetical protein DFH28DRAFT_933978 [Melampsora americana]|nr:hypothetical protein DFH28DRAFT_933978 [Melampsora americana]